MADEAKGTYTSEFNRRLDRQEQRSMSEAFLNRAHPTETALAKADLDLFKNMEPNEQLSYVVKLHRGGQDDLTILLAALGGGFGAGKYMQAWFPYTFAGNVPTLPTVLGGAGLVLGYLLRRRASFRFPVALAGAGLMLGGGSISGMKL
jgi:hypothetical protein